MLCCWSVVLDISEGHAASFFSYGGTMILQNVGTLPGMVLAVVACPGLDIQVL